MNVLTFTPVILLSFVPHNLYRLNGALRKIWQIEIFSEMLLKSYVNCFYVSLAKIIGYLCTFKPLTCFLTD